MDKKLRIKSKVKLLKDIKNEDGELIKKGEIDYIERIDEKGYWLRDNNVYMLNEFRDQHMEVVPEREEIVKFIENNYKEFVKTLIMLELNIKNEEELEEMHNEYMKRDEMKLINDGFEEMRYNEYNHYNELEL